MVKRYVVYAANCICDAPPNSDGQYVLVADYDALAARLAALELAAWEAHEAIYCELEEPDQNSAAIISDAIAKLGELLPVQRPSVSASVNHWQCMKCGWMNTDPYCPCTAEPDVTCATHGCTYRDGTCIRCWSREAVISAPACNHFPGQSTCEWCSAPAVQPCGHPWKAQHDFKCILCSSPGVTP